MLITLAVTDDQGNRNNLLIVPTAMEEAEVPKPNDIEQEKSKSGDTASGYPDVVQPNAEHSRSIPKLVVEKVDAEPRYGDDCGPQATVARKDAHEMRAKDTAPDQVIVRSGTSTPIYAATA